MRQVLMIFLPKRGLNTLILFFIFSVFFTYSWANINQEKVDSIIRVLRNTASSVNDIQYVMLDVTPGTKLASDLIGPLQELMLSNSHDIKQKHAAVQWLKQFYMGSKVGSMEALASLVRGITAGSAKAQNAAFEALIAISSRNNTAAYHVFSQIIAVNQEAFQDGKSAIQSYQYLKNYILKLKDMADISNEIELVKTLDFFLDAEAHFKRVAQSNPSTAIIGLGKLIRKIDRVFSEASTRTCSFSALRNAELLQKN